ncbi:PREDICTED: uncharacterized protein LOC106116095 [Papilio xuthus]|uniref:Uncharacterized protein LOC106116095 n=2 Tax=Papilio xuthus TaxID=66420 RepID=A0AAJ6Z4L3_PAPXU|nr:PREDICTED: uncharacterized protein LOC106116095 [Papilio xuthus]
MDYTKTFVLQITVLVLVLKEAKTLEEGYLGHVKDACYMKGEALSCMKYKALKIATNTFFGDIYSNETIRASKMISFVPLDEEAIKEVMKNEEEEALMEPRSLMSEWSEFTKYLMKLVKEFFKTKGLKVDLPEGARTIEETDDDARGKKKKLAVMIPLLNLLATLKTKLLLIPILLAVLLIKKLLLVAALLVPSLLSTLKSCKHHHPMTHYSSYFDGGSSDFNSDYGSSYAYSTGGGYGKDYASNRAYLLPKHRPTPAPMYITAPGTTA